MSVNIDERWGEERRGPWSAGRAGTAALPPFIIRLSHCSWDPVGGRIVDQRAHEGLRIGERLADDQPVD